MKIYVSHSKKYDFKNELYLPLRSSKLNSLHEIVLPHEESGKQFNSRDYISTCDVVVAEVSLPATGQGIELGWADAARKPIICLYKEGSDPAGSLKVVSKTFIEYSNSNEMIEKLSQALETIKE